MPDSTNSSAKPDGVFRQPIVVSGQRLGMVGFDRKDGQDLVRIVGWRGDIHVGISFPVAAIPELVAQLQHMDSTKERPDDASCYGFQKRNASA